MHFILQTIWFLLPAGAANMAASLSAVLWPGFNQPVDFRRNWSNRRILGDNKTFRGIIAGVILGTGVFLLQKKLVVLNPFGDTLGFFDYQAVSWSVGILFSLGALLGDLAGSFLKRRLNMEPGKSWFPFDQVDWIFGTLVFAAPVVRLPFRNILLILIVGLVLHLLVKFIGHFLGIDKKQI